MADEHLGGQLAAEPAAAPVEGAEGEQTTEQQGNPIEALASEMGWAPQDQFRGNPEDWKPADEYIRAGRDINRSLSRDVRSLREQMSRVGNVTEQIIADKVAERDRYWQTQHQQAVDAGDQELARTAVGELVKLQTQAPSTQQNGEPSETQQFRERHKGWFGEGGNRLATMRAMEVAEKSRLMGATVEQQLEDAEAVVRREYPELFQRAKAPAAVQTGQARNGGQGSAKKGFADMPADSQAVARDFLARHGVPLENTAASYWADIERNGRKVG